MSILKSLRFPASTLLALLTFGFRWMALYGILIVCTGCASVLSHTESQEEVGPYAGIRADGQMLAHPNSIQEPPVHPAVVVPITILDLPLSAALDTLLLPIDLTYRKTEAPAAIELELEEIKLSNAVMSQSPGGPSSVPVRLKIRNPRPEAVKLKTGCLARIISCCDFVDVDGQKWGIPWGGFGAIYDERAVVSLKGRSELVFEFAVYAGRELLKPVGAGLGMPEGVRAPSSLHFSVRDSHVQTESGAWIPIKGSGTVSVQR